MSGAQLEVVVLVPFLLLAVALVAAFAWVPEAGERRSGGGGDGERRGPGGHPASRIANLVRLVGTWLVLTTLTIWCGVIVAFLVLHGILFTLGEGAASVALFVTVLLLEIAPFAWAVVVVRRARRAHLPGGDGTDSAG